ncbi:hypothetical protein BU15DRAFT_64350 [Melanogaster broomeanus]|nr:hypothetical protein BU15DRAFT_64350 [Melanogaster broomeanus]
MQNNWLWNPLNIIGSPHDLSEPLQATPYVIRLFNVKELQQEFQQEIQSHLRHKRITQQLYSILHTLVNWIEVIIQAPYFPFYFRSRVDSAFEIVKPQSMGSDSEAPVPRVLRATMAIAIDRPFSRRGQVTWDDWYYGCLRAPTSTPSSLLRLNVQRSTLSGLQDSHASTASAAGTNGSRFYKLYKLESYTIACFKCTEQASVWCVWQKTRARDRVTCTDVAYTGIHMQKTPETKRVVVPARKKRKSTKNTTKP